MNAPRFLGFDEVEEIHRDGIALFGGTLGNKRAAIGTALTFLEGNGVTTRSATSALYDAMIGIAERRMSKADVAALLRKLFTT